MERLKEQRTNNLTWDECFLSMVAVSSLKSELNKEGACIIDTNHRILSMGYDEKKISFNSDALSNAIYTFKGRNQEFEGGTVYLSSFPDVKKSRQIAQARLKNVIYFNKNIDKVNEEIATNILENAHVTPIPYFDDKYSKEEYRNFLEELRNVIKKYIGLEKTNVLTNVEYFMSLATISSLRSKDPSTQVGACLVSKEGQVLSIGYNGATFNMDDDYIPWKSLGEITNDPLRIKDPYIVHAEINVFDNYRGNMSDFNGSSLYLIYSPCETCSTRITYTNIDKIVYLREYTKNNISSKSKKIISPYKTQAMQYNQMHNFSKDECIEFFEETTDVIKKNLKRN